MKQEGEKKSKTEILTCFREAREGPGLNEQKEVPAAAGKTYGTFGQEG